VEETRLDKKTIDTEIRVLLRLGSYIGYFCPNRQRRSAGPRWRITISCAAPHPSSSKLRFKTERTHQLVNECRRLITISIMTYSANAQTK